MRLAPDAAHVYLTLADEIPENRMAALEDVLPAEELDRAGRFAFPKDRRLYVIARAHIRLVLSQYARVRPIDWRFRATTFGKPFIANQHESAPLCFSLSHTAGMVSSLVSRVEDSGIDTEHVERQTDCLKLAKYAFTPGESAALELLSGVELKWRFYEYWTLKEAYSKARGLGLSIGLDQISFAIDQNHITPTFESSLGEKAKDWHFKSVRPSPSHQLGIAMKSTEYPQIKFDIKLADL